MTSFVAPAPLLNLEAPLPQGRRFTILSTVPVRERESDRWLAGSWIEDRPPGPAFTHDPCSDGTERVKEDPGDIDTQRTSRFTVYLPAFCTAQSIGPNPDRWLAKLRQAFDIYEASAVERILASSDGHTDFGSYLADENLDILAGGDVQDALVAYGLLEEAIAAHGGGVLHIGPRTFAAWQAANLLMEISGVLYSRIGTPVVVGYGYVNVTPVNGDAAGDREEWAFASGPLELIRDPDVTITPPNYDEALDRSLNDVLFLAERPYMLNWLARTSTSDRDHIQSGVLVNTGLFASIAGPTGPQGPAGPAGIPGIFDALAYVREEQPSGTDAGTPTGGTWNTRVLNTEVFDTDGIVALAGNQFTLQAGTYFIEARAPFLFSERTKLRLRNITDGATAAVGGSAYITSNAGESWVRGRVTIAAAKAFELQHWFENGLAAVGLGTSSDTGEVEVYAEVWIWRES